MSAKLKRYRVHIYAIVRVSVDVEAESPQTAVDKADTHTDLPAIFRHFSACHLSGYNACEYADDVDSFLVDELNASGKWDEHCKSIAFDKERRPQ